MFNYMIKAGSADVSVVIRIIDSTDGTPETGVVFNTSGIDIQYRREGATSTAITEATLAALTTSHTDGGFLHIGNGYYRLDLPDAAVASGVAGVLVHGTVTGMVVIGCYIQLVAYDPFDAVRLGLTSLPNAAAQETGGLFTRGTGAGQINQDANGRIDVNVAAISNDSAAADILEVYMDGTPLPANVVQISGDTTAADNLETSYDDSAGAVPWHGIIDQGTAQAATGSTLQLRAAATLANDTAIGMIVMAFGATQGYWQVRQIIDYDAATDTATVDPWTVTPSGSPITYKVFAAPPAPATPPTVALSTSSVNAVADQVWDETLSGHLGAGSTGNALNAAGSAGDPWSTALPGAYGAGTAGSIIGNNLNATVSSRASQTSVDTVQADTDNLQTRIPAALVSGRMDASVGAMAADVITSAALAASAVTEIQTGLSTLDAAGVRTAVGLASANLDTQIAAVQSDTNDIQTRIPAALVSGRMDASVGAMANNSMTAAALATDAVNEIQSGLATTAALATVAGYIDTEVAAIKAVTDKLDTTVELDSSVYRFTANALENAPSGGGGGASDWTVGEKEQIRHRLGIDGDAAAPAATPSLATASAVTTVGAAVANVQADTDNIQTRLPAALVGGRIDAIVGAVANDAITAAGLAADVATELQSGLATSAALATVAGYIDTEVAAIKAKTDQLNFTSGAVQADVQRVDGTEIVENGSGSTNWGAV